MVKIGEMFYALSSDPITAQKGECGGALTAIMKFLLNEDIVDAVLAVKPGADLYDAVPSLISDPAEVIESAGSLHCGTLNMAKTLEKYLDGAKNIRVAVTTKPCDAMTILELIKREKVKKENIIMLGVNCGGTLPPIRTMEMIGKFYEINPYEVLNEEIARGKLIIETLDHEKSELDMDDLEKKGYGRRSNCRRCEINIPRMADLAFGSWGVLGPFAGKATFVEVISKTGADVLYKAINAGVLKVHEPLPDGVELRRKIDGSMINLARKWQSHYFKPNENDVLSLFFSYGDEFSKCIKCFGCRESCPICYCEDCTIEAKGPEWLSKCDIPPEPFFHLERLIHIADSCTNCGQCEDVCPADIPLSRIIHTMQSRIQDLFGYFPGLDNKKPPLSYLFIRKHH